MSISAMPGYGGFASRPAYGGFGGSYHLDKKFALFAEVAAGTRFRKVFYQNHNAYAGIRYLFD